MPLIPAYVEPCDDATDVVTKKPTAGGLVATCTACAVQVRLAHGSKARETRPRVIERLSAECECPGDNVHADRAIPRGVSVWYVFPGNGRRYPVLMCAAKKPVIASGPVLNRRAELRVSPDAKKHAAEAADFANSLRLWGYTNVEVDPVPEPATK